MIFLGHTILEAFISILIIFGLSAVVNYSAIRIVSSAGGLSLCIFGVITLIDSKNSSLGTELKSVARAPVLAGIITSASNPYFWIWWLSAGNGLIMEGLKIGLIAAGFFVAGHWIADTVWYSLVSSSFGHGRAFISAGAYRHIVATCGLFLIFFGLWFIIRRFN